MVGVQSIGKKVIAIAEVHKDIKKLHRRESNPGRKRERLECYQLHHNGLHNYTNERLLILLPIQRHEDR